MVGCVYIIKNTLNSRVYVGKTTRDLEIRFREHCSNNSGCFGINRAIKKYGKENFNIEPIFLCETLEELNKKEEELILELNSLSPNGYNLKLGESAPAMSVETKEKMSKSANERWKSKEARKKVSQARMGFVVAENTKKKISQSKTGIPKSEETKRRMSEAWIGIPKPKSETWCHNQSLKMTGKTHSNESKIKMAERKKKSVICNETNIVYPSILETAKTIGCHKDNLSRHLSGKYKACMGLTFQFVEKSNES